MKVSAVSRFAAVDPLVSALQANGNKLAEALEQIGSIKQDRGEITAINVKQPRFSDTALNQLGGLKRVERLSLSGTKVTSDGLAALSGYGRLRELWIDKTQIGDEGLASRYGIAGTCWDGVAGKAALADREKLYAARPIIEAAGFEQILLIGSESAG